MKIKELVEAKDPHAWVEKKVHAILNKGDKAALLKKSDKDLVHLVLQARDNGELHYAKTQVVLPFVQSWRAKQQVTEGYTLKKTKKNRLVQVGPLGSTGPSGEKLPEFDLRDTHYDIIDNASGKVVGTAFRSVNNYFGRGALHIKMKNGAKRFVEMQRGDKGDPQAALNRFMKDPKTSKKYTTEEREATK